MWPTNSPSGEVAISAATKERTRPIRAGIAAKGARQAWPQTGALPLSSGGQALQSPMSPSAIAAEDIASDMLVAVVGCATVPAANTTSRTIAKMRSSLRMTLHASLFLPHVQYRHRNLNVGTGSGSAFTIIEGPHMAAQSGCVAGPPRGPAFHLARTTFLYRCQALVTGGQPVAGLRREPFETTDACER